MAVSSHIPGEIKVSSEKARFQLSWLWFNEDPMESWKNKEGCCATRKKDGLAGLVVVVFADKNILVRN